MSTQCTLWLPGIGEDFVLGPREINAPGPGERLVKSLNPLDWKRDLSSSSPTWQSSVKRLLELWKTLMMTSLISIKGTEYFSSILQNIPFDQAASVQVGIIPVVVALYARQPEGLGHITPWVEGGNGKYDGQPIVIIGGTSSVGRCTSQCCLVSSSIAHLLIQAAGLLKISLPHLPTSLDWVAVEPDHSIIFCRGSIETGCWHLTLAITQPMKALYFDGNSAANSRRDTSMDTQDLVAWSEMKPE
ncbi:hypothetical protein DFJ58DRAFT_724269 [Suillus subalutaceus]|uniref:uncharacterized protein n=1 Tax=Suillus subalutaceus TaxID=48586 RepID=UPI001B8784A1|nr:uncharacterized protein DFJ58DRAFT_724269 [Suillus subalutaceus]KAG1865875.1 hypothetical protein DFJ58DRAFT_724269 [Suillus subalutaceus]